MVGAFYDTSDFRITGPGRDGGFTNFFRGSLASSYARNDPADFAICRGATGETVCDLGCGEGRVLITAAKEFSARAIGVEIDPLKILLARLLRKINGVDDRVNIVRGNLFDFDPGSADVLYLYLTHQAMDKLFPEILKKLKPSVRIVSYRFCLRGMTPEKVSEDKTLFLYQLDKGTKINSYS